MQYSVVKVNYYVMLISVIYGATVLTVLPGGFSHYVHLLEQYAPGAAVLVPLKALLLIPLVYHSVNGFRHLVRPIVKCKIRIGILFMRRILVTYHFRRLLNLIFSLI